MTERKRIYTRVPAELYERLQTMARAGGFRSVHALVTSVLTRMTAMRTQAEAAAAAPAAAPGVEDEIESMFREWSESQAPVYGMGRRRRGHREP